MLTNDQFIEGKQIFSNNQCIWRKKNLLNDHGIVFNFFSYDHGIGGKTIFQMIMVLEVCSGLFAVDLVIPESLETRSQSSRPTNLKKEFGETKKKNYYTNTTTTTVLLHKTPGRRTVD